MNRIKAHVHGGGSDRGRLELGEGVALPATARSTGPCRLTAWCWASAAAAAVNWQPLEAEAEPP